MEDSTLTLDRGRRPTVGVAPHQPGNSLSAGTTLEQYIGWSLTGYYCGPWSVGGDGELGRNQNVSYELWRNGSDIPAIWQPIRHDVGRTYKGDPPPRVAVVHPGQPCIPAFPLSCTPPPPLRPYVVHGETVGNRRSDRRTHAEFRGPLLGPNGGTRPVTLHGSTPSLLPFKHPLKHR